jgi:hypothetical protein
MRASKWQIVDPSVTAKADTSKGEGVLLQTTSYAIGSSSQTRQQDRGSKNPSNMSKASQKRAASKTQYKLPAVSVDHVRAQQLIVENASKT